MTPETTKAIEELRRLINATLQDSPEQERAPIVDLLNLVITALETAERERDEAITKIEAQRQEKTEWAISTSGAIAKFCQERDEARAACAAKNEMLRAFRYSMDRTVPFPSLEKLTALINDDCGKDLLAEREQYRKALDDIANFWASHEDWQPTDVAKQCRSIAREALAPKGAA